MSVLDSTGLLNRRHALFGGMASLGMCALPRVTAQDQSQEKPEQEGGTRLSYETPQVQNWRIGLVLKTPVTCTDVFATFPVPMNWPEQKVTVTGRTIDPQVTGWDTRELGGGVKQVMLKMARVTAGSTVAMTFNIAIERSRIVGPTQTEDLVIPAKIGRDLRFFLSSSPYIDSSNARIKAAWRGLAAEEVPNAWARVEQIYDFVRDKVKYVEGSLKNASQALREGRGDCEEMTSLFVALCRNAKIPARMVWIPEHCYPEFYLEDASGKGHWFPCQAAGTRQFGRMDEYRPVLQKGDRFKVPEKRTITRYVSEFFKCDKKGKSNPDPNFIREIIDV